jgi:hypothetical protein
VRHPLILLTAVLMLVSAEARGDDGAAGFDRWFDIRNTPLIPIPEVATDPTSGTSIGVLPVYLVTNANKQITRIYAPDVIYHPGLGLGGRFRVLSYPSKDTNWTLIAGAKQRIEREADAEYATGITRTGPWSFAGRVNYDVSATPLFYGIGNDTPPSNRANYIADQGYVSASLGYNLTRSLQLAVSTRPRFLTVEPGVLSRSIPASLTGGQNDWLHQLAIAYDSRDSTAVPTQGTYGVLYAGASDRAFLSSLSYSLAGFDVTHLAPLDPRFTLAGHLALRYMPTGSNLPFWTQSSLGGESTAIGQREPLRGFGEDRFIDRNLFAASLELRTRVFDLYLFSQQVSFEAAPFIDAGRVFHDLGDFPAKRLHAAGGVGLRAIAPPFIVGHLDFGYGGEGLAIFSGIDYPF